MPSYKRSSAASASTATAAAAASPSSDKENAAAAMDADGNANNAAAAASAASTSKASSSKAGKRSKRDRSSSSSAAAAEGRSEDTQDAAAALLNISNVADAEGEEEASPPKRARRHRTARNLLVDDSDDEHDGQEQDDDEEEGQDEEEEEEFQPKDDDEDEEDEEEEEDDLDEDDLPASQDLEVLAMSPERRKKPKSRTSGKQRGGGKGRGKDGADAVVRPSPAAEFSQTAALVSSPLRHVNPAGKPAEAGIIRRVYVENFMCHRKLTVDLCRNVNFIYGQNGSGKSAILAAVQICLGAGAKRTHRARNLKELVRKESGANCTGAKVRVTLLNRGTDGFQRDIYGDSITVERCISLRGGYNGYKLLDENLTEKSRSKKDLDAMLDQLNIQVENPVAVLDQEEAKKFLTGKPEDKYAFFCKATELERLDRTYAEIKDNIEELDETNDRVRKGLSGSRENVQQLKREWEQFQELEKLEDKVADQRVNYCWAVENEFRGKADLEEQNLSKIEGKLEKRREDVEKAEEAANVTDDQEQALKERMNQLTEEAQEAEAAKINLETELKQAEAPVKKLQRDLHNLKKEQKKAHKGLKDATRRLQDARDEILRAAGNKESEEAKRTAKMEKAERDLSEARDEEKRQKEIINDNLQKYEAIEPDVDQAKEEASSAANQHGAIKMKIRDLQSSVGNNLAVFGQKAVAMHGKVEEAKRKRQFRGPVVGPIGIHIKIAQGKEHLAKIAELALGPGALDRYVVTNDADRALFQKLREKVGCSSRDCNLFQQAQEPRFNIPPPPSNDVETVASVLNIENDLVFNCLVNNSRIDQRALAESKEISERALLIKGEGGRESIRGGKIRDVYFLPQGDNWSLDKKGRRMMISNEKQLRQTIGIDRTAAIKEAEREMDLLKEEVQQTRAKEARLLKEKQQYKVAWNRAQKDMKKAQGKISNLENTIEDIKAEAENAENVTIDTTEHEEDVKAAEEAVEELKGKEEEKEAAIEDLQPGIEESRKLLEETTTRNEKVLADLEHVEKQIEDYVKGHAQRQAKVEKTKHKLAQIEGILEKQRETVADVTEKARGAMDKARQMSFKRDQDKERHQCKEDGREYVPREASAEDLEAIEPVTTKKDPAYYKAKIEQGMKKIEREKDRRKLTESDPEVAYQKYQRAKHDLESKMEKIEHIEENIAKLLDDSKERKRRWKQFRNHIEVTTNSIFDELLNKKGSSGQLSFDHNDATLNLIVQKDSNEMSQTKDVKALSGGERSFTTLALLLALGENLETPFRVMDEFDVFLDPVSRKIALETMIAMAKDMEHRQFIFITPQDLSSTPTDSRLKIFQMKAPKRGAVGGEQQTLAFESPSQSQ